VLFLNATGFAFGFSIAANVNQLLFKIFSQAKPAVCLLDVSF
jgi:hypothetical protein